MNYTIHETTYTDGLTGEAKTAFIKLWEDGTSEEYLGSTAEEHLKNEGYGSLQLLALLDLELKLMISGKSNTKLQQTRAWLDGVLAQSITNPSPQITWSPAPYTFPEVSSESLQTLLS